MAHRRQHRQAAGAAAQGLILSKPARNAGWPTSTAHERGEVAIKEKPVNIPNGNIEPVVTDIGLTSKQVHQARRGLSDDLK